MRRGSFVSNSYESTFLYKKLDCLRSGVTIDYLGGLDKSWLFAVSTDRSTKMAFCAALFCADGLIFTIVDG